MALMGLKVNDGHTLEVAEAFGGKDMLDREYLDICEH